MDRNIWCQPEQRGPALDTWTSVLAMATKAFEATRHDAAPTVVQMNGVPSSSASSTSSKMGEQSDDDAAAASPSRTPSLSNGHHQQEAKSSTEFDGFIRLYSPPANGSTDGESDSLTNRSWRGTRPESRSPLTANGHLPNNNLLMRNRARTLPFDGSLSDLCRRHGGAPWVIPSDKTYPISMIGLHEEIIDFYNWIKPSPVERRLREQVFYRLSSVVHELWPGARVDYFGSFRTGLFLPTSDIDVVVYGNWEALPHWTLAKALVREGFADESCIKVLDKAAVPIVKLVDNDTEIRLDISFNVSYGIQAAQLINDFIQTFPALKYLVFTLKQFLLQRDLNEVFTGGVSSYSLIMMVISFLQLHPTRDLRHVQIHNLNLGVLLIEFLELYGREFNYLKTALRIRDGGAYVSKDEIQQQMQDGYRSSMLCIEDPLQPGNDIGRGSHGAIHVKRAFEHALYFLLPVLFRGGSQNIFSERGSVLARVIRVTDEVIDYRERLRGRLFQQAASSGGYDNVDVTGALTQISQQHCPPQMISYAVVAGKRPLSSKSSKSSSKKTTVTSDDDDMAFPKLPPSSGASSISDLSSDEADTDESTRSSGTDLSMTTSKRSYSSVAGSTITRPSAVVSPVVVCSAESQNSVASSSAAGSRRASSDSTSASPMPVAASDASSARPMPEPPTTVKKQSPVAQGQGSTGVTESMPVGRQVGGRGGFRGGAQGGGSSQRYNGGGGSYRNSTPRKKARGGYQEHRGEHRGSGQRPRGQRDPTAAGGDSYHHYPHVRTVYRSSNKGGARGRGGGTSHSTSQSTSTSTPTSQQRQP